MNNDGRDYPMFSVIILSYNNSQFIFSAIDSVLRQTYPNIELIVADDKSEEFDLEKIKKHIITNSFKNIISANVYQNASNFGTVKNINDAIKCSSGDYIKILSADDALYDENVLDNAAKGLRNNIIITSDVVKCGVDLRPIKVLKKRFTKKINSFSSLRLYKTLCVHNEIVATGVFFSKAFFNKYGLFDEEYRLLEDWPTWLRISRQGETIKYCPFYSAKYRSNVGSATSTNAIYLDDKEKTFLKEIRPYKKTIGGKTYFLSLIMIKVVDSVFLREVYGFLKRKD